MEYIEAKYRVVNLIDWTLIMATYDRGYLYIMLSALFIMRLFFIIKITVNRKAYKVSIDIHFLMEYWYYIISEKILTLYIISTLSYQSQFSFWN